MEEANEKRDRQEIEKASEKGDREEIEKASEKGGAEGGKGPRTNGFMTLKVPSTAPIPMAACRPSRAQGRVDFKHDHNRSPLKLLRLRITICAGRLPALTGTGRPSLRMGACAQVNGAPARTPMGYGQATDDPARRPRPPLSPGQRGPSPGMRARASTRPRGRAR